MIPDNAPQWLKDAHTINADVTISPFGAVVWHGGEWHGGVWHGGVWLDGVWLDGVWLDGMWLDGVWYGGEWHGGVWHGGEWHGGKWLDGVWYGGEWHGGEWHGGVWFDGEWHGGVWLDGEWRSGYTAIRSAWTQVINPDGSISIGCKTMTPDEWINWFEMSEEEFQTPRNSDKFKMIRAHFYATLEYMKRMAE